jgi:hypothetical protein
MTASLNILTAGRRQTAALSVFLLVQTLGTVFFVGDVIGDLRADPMSVHFIFEAVVTSALVLGILFGTFALRRTIELLRAQDQALQVARGALSNVIDGQFQAWSLTPAERDVGLLALKGLDVAEIADLRPGHGPRAADPDLLQGRGLGPGPIRGLLRGRPSGAGRHARKLNPRARWFRTNQIIATPGTSDRQVIAITMPMSV